MPEPLAATNSSNDLRSSAEIQRASWNSLTSNSTGSAYSALGAPDHLAVGYAPGSEPVGQ